MSYRRMAFESATARLTLFGDRRALLTDVEAMKPHQGHGRGLMEEVISYADQHQLTIELWVQGYGPTGSMNDAELEAWYSTFGFELANTSRPHKMVRPARVENMAYYETPTT